MIETLNEARKVLAASSLFDKVFLIWCLVAALLEAIDQRYVEMALPLAFASYHFYVVALHQFNGQLLDCLRTAHAQLNESTRVMMKARDAFERIKKEQQ